MTGFLIRSFDDPKGSVERDYPDGRLPRSAAESYVPWGLTADQRVVYAQTGAHGGWRGGSGRNQLRPYDSMVSQMRRRLCQSDLGVMALAQPAFTKPAVDKVTAASRFYLRRQVWSNQQRAVRCVYDEIGHYFFTGGRTGFGRISVEDKKSLDPLDVWKAILHTMENGRLDQVMAIHDAIGRKILPALGGAQLVEYEALGPVVRQDWFDDPKRRGRANAPTRAKATTIGGIAPGPGVGEVAQSRTRGVDSFVRDTKRTRDADADSYYDDAGARNLLFGAGISGTTGTLLQAGMAFGKLASGEEMKQYVLAIVGYLIGGGMHSYHETMAVAAELGVPYNPGAYEGSLPTTFVATMAFRDWCARYYDIVVLGALHWRHNTTCLPSHLNRELTGPGAQRKAPAPDADQSSSSRVT